MNCLILQLLQESLHLKQTIALKINLTVFHSYSRMIILACIIFKTAYFNYILKHGGQFQEGLIIIIIGLPKFS